MVATWGRHGGCNSEMVAARSSLLISGELDRQGYEQNRVPYQFQCMWFGDGWRPRRTKENRLERFSCYFCFIVLAMWGPQTAAAHFMSGGPKR